MTEDDEVAGLVELLTARLQAGETVDLDALLGPDPARADAIRDVLPALGFLIQATRARGRRRVLRPDEDDDPSRISGLNPNPEGAR